MSKLIELPISQIAEVYRGASLSPANIKERTVTEDTGIQYISVSHIQDNYIQSELPFLKNIEDREYKYLLKENDLLLAKMGRPKFAFVRNIGARKIISTQNFYQLRFKENINPLYVKAFFESELGFSRLEAAYVKSTIPTLPIKNLEFITIPLPEDEKESIEFQNDFVKKYEAEENKEMELYTKFMEQRKNRIQLFSEMLGTLN